MAANELLTMTISEVAPMIESGAVSPVEVARAAIEQAERLQPLLKGFITLRAEAALEEAAERERSISNGGYRGPLDGIPVGLKDNIATEGVLTTIGSRVFEDHVPDSDAYAVERLKSAGAIILGKENLHEFAGGVPCDNPYYGSVSNPWDPDYVAGGSSGGSGANVAACVTFASLGTDLGGSVRIPCAMSGIVGMKQTFGRVSQRGLLATSFNGDHIAPMTRSVRDNALVLQAIAGSDPLDPSSVPVPVPDFCAELGRDLSGIKVGVPAAHYFATPLDPCVEALVRAAITKLEDMGADVRPVDIECVEFINLMYIGMAAEGFVTHEPYLESRRHLYRPEMLHRLLAGQFVLARDYVKSMKAQRLIMQDFYRILQDVDVLATPTVPITAFRKDAHSMDVGGVTVPAMDLGARGPEGGVPPVHAARFQNIASRNTRLSNTTGLPSITVPAGFAENGLPAGLQLIGRPFEEPLLYGIASRYEQESPARGKLPPVAL